MASLAIDEFAELQSAALDDLYAQLGRAADPGSPLIGLGQEDLQAMMSSAGGFELPVPNWIKKGLEFFQSAWDKVGSAVCAIYRDYSDINKDWVEKVAEAIVGLLNIGWAVAVIIVNIAIKRGLAHLCPT